MNRGQVNQVFIFIIAILVVGVIVIVGVRSMSGLIDDKCTADFVTFQDRLRDAVLTNNDYKAVNEAKLSSPCGYQYLCMVDSRHVKEGNLLNGFTGEKGSFIIRDSVKDKVEANVFLVNANDDVKEVGYISQLHTNEYNSNNNDGVLCVEAKSGRFRLRLNGEGRTTLVTEP
jgi:hypothetical protein